jgi:hypothetical protein
MTQIKINKKLESTGANLITLERITLDESASAEIRITAFLALKKRNKEYPVQLFNQGVESNNLNIAVDSNNRLNV